MVYFFHHYELPAILRRGAHIVAEGQIIEGQLELEILNPPVQNATDNLNEAVENADAENEINISTNDADGNNAAQTSSDLDTQEPRSNSNPTSTNGETLRQRVHLPSDGEMINNSGLSTAQTPNVDSPLNNLDNYRTS
ncbi:Hypothetical predicted protein [Paramuricea clavata]|uniref:Uncharacterized protein n=1 Tax=Paramuricea clavata TaxID=317549 RepID=A0A7D9DF66_PARCT|nr:Hypothetical predicted protein [Paramuricea clavata]